MLPTATVALLALTVRPQLRSPPRVCRNRGLAACTSEEQILLTADGGLQKTILAAAPEEASKPEWGALVRVSYTATLANGTIFEERAADSPFEFQLNTGSAIDGLSRGVASMRVGERALLTCAPEYAHGGAGVPGRIPPDSTLRYDVELLDWSEGPEVVNDDFDMQMYKQSLEGRDSAHGRTADYRWSEGGEEVTLWVALPGGQGARDVRCTFSSRELQLQIGEDGPRIGGRLKGRVVTEDCYWVIDDDADGTRSVQVVLAKAGHFMRWDGAVIGEAELAS